MKTELPRRLYLISPASGGWQIVVTRDGLVEGEPIAASSRAEACRLAHTLAESGLVGFIKEDLPWTPHPPTSTNAVL